MSFSGHQLMLILQVLANGDRTALEVIGAVAKATKGRVKISEGSIYTQLARLEKQGLVKGYYGKQTPAERGGRPRRYYQLMAAGIRAVNDLDAVRGLELANG
jgi:PadR family transcriptional regulator, regulatory protein PadR